MAHLREIHRPRCGHCARHATHELYDTHNALHGAFCARHASAALARLQADEERRYGGR